MLAKDSINTPFVLPALEELRDTAAVQGVLTIFSKEIDCPENNVEVSVRIAATLNLILSFNASPKISEIEAQRIRAFLFRLYPFAGKEVDRATVVLALRGVGNEDALAFLATVKAFSGAWSEVKSTTARSIKQRLRANAGY